MPFEVHTKAYFLVFIVLLASPAQASKKCADEFLFQIGLIKKLPIVVEFKKDLGFENSSIEYDDILKTLQLQYTQMLENQTIDLLKRVDAIRFSIRKFNDINGNYIENFLYEEGRRALRFNQFKTSVRRKFGRAQFNAQLDIIPTSSSIGPKGTEDFLVIISVVDPVSPQENSLSPLAVFAHKGKNGLKIINSRLDELGNSGQWKVPIEIYGDKKIDPIEVVNTAFYSSDFPLNNWIQRELDENGFVRKKAWTSETIQTGFSGVPSRMGYGHEIYTDLSSKKIPNSEIFENSPYARMELWTHPTKGSLIIGVREVGLNLTLYDPVTSKGNYYLQPFIIVPEMRTAHGYLQSLGINQLR